MARAMKDSGIEWIGEIPEGWEVARVSSCFSEVKEKNTDNLYDNALQFKMGRIIPKPRKWDAEEIGETYSAYTIVHPGTIMVNGLNLEFDFVTQRVAIVEEDGIITSAYIAMRPNGSVDPDYMCYLLKAYDYRRALHNMGKGLRKILNYSELKTKPILLPTLPEQKSIVKALNAECARIDAVIEQTRASIEEYKKLKQSVITQAVTKGIRPDRKMKDSGNNDMGCIPNEWEIVRLKYLTTDIVDCPHETPEYSLDGEYFVIRTADQDYARLRSDANMFRLAYNQYVVRTRRMTLDKDDIVYGREGERWGLACIVPESGKYCLGQRMMQFRCDEKRILPLFAMYALSSSHVRRQGEYDTFGSTSPHVNISTIRNYRIPLPIISEQKEICEYIHEKVLYLDTLVDKKEKEVAELESYKKSLIFEYVTGKKEVGQ